MLIEMLESLGYQITEYLVSPCDPWINIPNNRLRYYLTAKRVQRDRLAHTGHIYRSFEELLGLTSTPSIPRPIRDFLIDPQEPHIVPSFYLTEYKNYRHDIARPDDFSCTTFTKSYGSKHIIGNGSFLQTTNFALDYKRDDPVALQQVGLRYFEPREIANLHGLGQEFTFPDDVSRVSRYRLLGNSLNVPVVSLILRNLFKSEDESILEDQVLL